ncbi:hypothetical protein BLA29_000949 [Euroglyphus maynei]|uniref:Uncharacterized protein n=1 Tax=Euroglyphus maynei TaxID=6958 RepID=A0A1Y3BTB6_EURMA|nr:hypothetical protein BLA29_000949 [Euroglyphus maynei]
MGNELYDELANITQEGKFGDQSLPWITLNEQYSEKAVKNLFDTICHDYGVIKNRRCSSLSSTMATDLRIYFSCDESGRKFIVNLIPYGNTKYENDTFICPTENECLANRYIACANYYHNSEFDGHLHLVEFTLCFLSDENYSNDIELAAKKCSEKVWFDVWNAENLKICAESNATSYKEIFLEMKTQTESIEPRLDHCKMNKLKKSLINLFSKKFPVPAITIGTKIEEETNILKLACNLYNGIDYPSECNQYVDDGDNESKSFPVWAIILIVIAVLVVIGLLFVCLRRNRS